jgi:hypothetical protein
MVALQSPGRFSHHDFREADARGYFEAAIGAGGRGGGVREIAIESQHGKLSHSTWSRVKPDND